MQSGLLVSRFVVNSFEGVKSRVPVPTRAISRSEQQLRYSCNSPHDLFAFEAGRIHERARNLVNVEVGSKLLARLQASCS